MLTPRTTRSHPPPHAGCPRGDPGPLSVLTSLGTDLNGKINASLTLAGRSFLGCSIKANRGDRCHDTLRQDLKNGTSPPATAGGSDYCLVHLFGYRRCSCNFSAGGLRRPSGERCGRTGKSLEQGREKDHARLRF